MYQWRYVIPIILLWCCTTRGEYVRNEDICGPHNGRRLYLELGEKGLLYGKNVSFTQNKQKQLDSKIFMTNSSHSQCNLELVTCPSCVIVVTFQVLDLPHHCGNAGILMDSPCRCDYIWLSEPPYEDVSGVPFCGLYSPITHRSSTRTLSIALLFSQSHEHAFTLEYSAERNRINLKGTKREGLGSFLNSTGGGILKSPFFPARYPRDLGMEYFITCPAETPSCRIRVLFSDFQLATVSIMEFYDWNGQRLDVSSGARFRPPVIVNSGPSLLIRFYANGGTGFGYKAFYSFVMGNLHDKSIQPITDCGGYVENLGGAITMMDIVSEGIKTYDCVWLIRPPKNFLHMKTHMFLKVITFANMGGTTELTIKQGPTSALMPLEVLRHPSTQIQPPRQKEHIVPVTSGFHVSLRGSFSPTSRLAIAYSAFSYMDCFTGSDFLCQNHRCIPSQLNCDGFDHCGDNSDEPATCFEDWDNEPQDRKWHVNKANYYFPKIDRYPDLKTATLVFVASSLGLIVLISALIVLLYRMGARARQQRELQSRLQTISELLDGARIDEVSIQTDEPPGYEAPPGYDEVVKLSHENEVRRRKKHWSNYREPRSRSSPSHSAADELNNQASTSLPVNHDSNSSSRESRNRISVECRPIPKSPPPPYFTPPFTGCNSTVQISTETEPTPEPFPRGHYVHRSWLRSRSLPSMDFQIEDVPPPPMDVEIIGAYQQDNLMNSTEHCAPQPSGLDGASTSTTAACNETSAEPGGPDDPAEDEPQPERSPKPAESCAIKYSIIRLLGNQPGKSRSHSDISTSTLCSGCQKTRMYSSKISIYSYDSLISKISSKNNSYEELNDEDDDQCDETTRILQTESNLYGTSNFESLDEGSKILESFLARRNQPETTPGIPKHKKRRISDVESQQTQRSKAWHSSCDQFFN